MKFLPENLFLFIFFIPLIVAVSGLVFIALFGIFQALLRLVEVFALACVGEDPCDDVKFALLPVTIDGQRVWMKKYYFVSVWTYGGSLHSGGYSKIVSRQLTPYTEDKRSALVEKHRHHRF